MAVSNQAAHQVDQEIGDAAMPRVFNLRNVLKLINDGFDNGPLSQQQFVAQRHQAIFHVAFEFGDQLNPKGLPQLFQEGLGHIAAIGKDLVEQWLDQLGYRLAVIDVSGCQRYIEQRTFIITDQMQFESEEPAG